MSKIEIYTLNICPYCDKAKRLFDKKGVTYEEINLDDNPEEGRAMMAERAKGFKSVPQIFINDQHIGGCDDLYALDDKGGLDPLLTVQ